MNLSCCFASHAAGPFRAYLKLSLATDVTSLYMGNVKGESVHSKLNTSDNFPSYCNYLHFINVCRFTSKFEKMSWYWHSPGLFYGVVLVTGHQPRLMSCGFKSIQSPSFLGMHQDIFIASNDISWTSFHQWFYHILLPVVVSQHQCTWQPASSCFCLTFCPQSSTIYVLPLHFCLPVPPSKNSIWDVRLKDHHRLKHTESPFLAK